MTYSILGIDISKKKFDVCLILQTGKFRHRVFPNTDSGCEQLCAWLLKQKVERVHACMEATGTYAEPLALYLHEAGQMVSVVNPARIKAYAQSHLSRTKTDKADAQLIAQFCQERHPPQWQPLPQEIADLQALVRRLEALSEMRQMEVNRFSAGVKTDSVRSSLTRLITYLDQEILDTEALISDHIGVHPTLREQKELLLSIPGIGETTSAKFLAEILDVKLYASARQLAAFAGLAPRLHESGSSVKKRARLSKVGTPRLRKALYFPAISAMRHNPQVRALSLRLKERGKCPMQIIGAAMRKLVHIAYGVLKSGERFKAEMKTA
jgi:transposase